MNVIVTGASGQLGRLVAAQLLERLSPADLVLVTRRPAALANLAARGVEVRRGDFDEPASLAEAFAGGERLMVISTTAIGRRVEQHRAAIEAAVAAGIRHVAYTSLTNPVADHPVQPVVDEHRETEAMLRASGMDWTILRNAGYSELQVPLGSVAVTHGKLYTNAGDGRIAPVSRGDCAAVAATVLTTDGHQGKTYEVTGPEALSQADIADVLMEVSGRSIKLVPIGDRKLLWSLARFGTPKPVARGIVDLGIATRENYFDVVDPAVEIVTGRPPRSLRDVLIAHRGELLDAA
jgi:NAD(P)H dehydrogenase (quinone)